MKILLRKIWKLIEGIEKKGEVLPLSFVELKIFTFQLIILKLFCGN